MDRRAFISGGVAAVALVPLVTNGQTPAKPHRIGLLMTTTPVAASHIVVAFADGLRELGRIEGQHVVFEYRWAEGRPERFAEMAADLVRQQVEVIVASSQAAALAAKRVTTTIPIVMVNVTDPVGNRTGVPPRQAHRGGEAFAARSPGRLWAVPP